MSEFRYICTPHPTPPNQPNQLIRISAEPNPLFMIRPFAEYYDSVRLGSNRRCKNKIQFDGIQSGLNRFGLGGIMRFVGNTVEKHEESFRKATNQVELQSKTRL